MPALHNWQENEEKFRELVLYISQKCAGDAKFGATKLNKILYFSDFLAYANSGEAITSFEYQRLPKGPAPRRLLPVRAKMMEDGILGLQEVRLRGGKTQKRSVNLRSPNLKIFTGEEIELVDSVIDALADADAETASELSHRMVGWQVVSDGETIPYGTIFLSNEPLTEGEVQRGRELAASLCGA
jgi:hypothetical protein